MRYVGLDTAKQISKIGLGTWQFGSGEWGYGEEYSEHVAYSIVRRAIELGVTLFDTAEIYGAGRSERILGRALGEERESLFIADKIFPLAPGIPPVRQRARASMNRLGVSQLDLYQAHYPNPIVSDRLIMRSMRSLRKAGLVGEVGVSNYSLTRWQAAEKALHGRVLSNQIEYSLLHRSPEHDLLPFAESHDRMIIAFSPLAQGLLSGRYHEIGRPQDRLRSTSSRFSAESIERTKPLMAVLREIADAHSASPAQIALAWAIRHPAVAAIPGASSVEQLESNVAAAELELSEDEYRALQAASASAIGVAAPRAPLRRKLAELKHSASAAPYLARTMWHDYKTESRP
jgi:aryl-alcohol dehydrogenase-like predicted oxidoreductase